VRIEQEITRKLFPARSDGRPSELYVEFNVDGLLRGDLKSRYDAYAVGRQWGWLSTNDIRSRENLEPVPDGDTDYLQPLNMVPRGQDPQGTETTP
jgi:phage portal protein BeeE